MTTTRRISLGIVLALVGAVFASPGRAAGPGATPGQGPVTRTRGSVVSPRVESVPIDALTLPRMGEVTRGRRVIPLVAGSVISDTFLVQSWGFDTPQAGCAPRDWRSIDLTPRTYTSVTSQYVANQTFAAELSGLRFMPPYVEVGTTPVPASGANVGRVDAITRDAAGRLVAFTRRDPVAGDVYGTRMLRLLPTGWVSFGSPLSTSFHITAAAYDPARARVLMYDAAGGLLWAVPQAGGLVEYVAGHPAGAPGDTLGIHHQFGGIGSMDCDAAGNVYFTTTGRIRMLRTDGRVVTIAGTGTPGSGGDGGDARDAQVVPRALAVPPSGGEVVFVESSFGTPASRRLRHVDFATGIIRTRVDLDPDPRYNSASAIAHVGGSYLVAVTPVLAQPVLNSEFLMRLEADSLVRVAGASTTAETFSAAVAVPSLRWNFDQVGALVSDGSGSAYVAESADEFTRPMIRFTPGAPIEELAGVGVRIDMGARAFSFGAESLADEFVPEGLNQYLVSPPVPTTGSNGIEVRFDGVLLTRSLDSNDYLVVEGLNSSGAWVRLGVTLRSPDNQRPAPGVGYGIEQGPTWVKVRARPNTSAPLAPTTPIRIRMKNAFVMAVAPGGAVVDNIAVQDTLGNAMLPFADFEDGTTAGWTVGAHNGAFEADLSYSGPNWPIPATSPALAPRFDFSNNSCVWSFSGGRDSVAYGVLEQLVSPWVPVARADSGVFAALSGKLPTTRFLLELEFFATLQTKRAGGPVVQETGFGPLFVGVTADLQSPYLDGITLHTPPTPGGADSVRVLFTYRHRFERSLPEPPPVGVPLPTRLPYLDDVRIFQLATDRDWDGVADASDACTTDGSVGQDADGDGCVDPTATLRHVETWPEHRLPIRIRLSAIADPRITDGSDLAAIRAAIGEWRGVTTAAVPLVEEAVTPQTNASSLDGVNLVTFEDSDFPFPANVVAVTPTLSFVQRGAFDDAMYLPGQIIDADILFNPAFRFSTSHVDGGPGSMDLQSAALHELGHLLGLSHSGVTNANMFYVLHSGARGQTPAADDVAAVSAAYPSETFSAITGTIPGRIRRGRTLDEVPGALVTAVRVVAGAPLDSVASDYSDEAGRFALRGLPPGEYAVRITPLDGEVGGVPLTPEDISARVAGIAQTDFAAEWYDAAESDHDDGTAFATLVVGAGAMLDSVVLVTNIDTVPPEVVVFAPPRDTVGQRIDTPILVRFSERLEPSTFSAATVQLRAEGSPTQLSGRLFPHDNNRAFTFQPDRALQFATRYEMRLTTGLTDREGVPLASDYVSAFTTMPQPALALFDLQPREAPAGGVISLQGTGFDAGNPANNRVRFTPCATCPATEVSPASVTPSEIVVDVPAGAASGDVLVITGAETSNPIALTVLPPSDLPAPAKLGVDIALGLSPEDVAVSADGLAIYAVGGEGLAVIVRRADGTLDGDVRHFDIGAARAVAVAPAKDYVYVSQPDRGQVTVVHADPADVTRFGSVRANIRLADDARPAGLALSTTGTQLYATDEARDVVHVLDTDPLSASFLQVLRELRDSTATLTGGIVTSPGGREVIFTTSNLGVRAFDLANGTSRTLSSAPAERGAAIAITGTEALFAGGLASPGELIFARPGLPSPTPGRIDLGGTVRDVAVTPEGRSALVVNGAYARLQVVGLDASDPEHYHLRLAEVATGLDPVAVSLSQNGRLVAVANAAGNSVSLYGTDPGAQLARLVPATAGPGDAVVVQAGGGVFSPGARADFGGSPAVPVTVAPDARAASFLLPAGAQGDLPVAIQQADDRRTPALTLRRLSAVNRFAPAPTGLAWPLAPGGCTVAPGAQMLESPDGRVVVTGRSFVTGCSPQLEFVDVSPGATFLGRRLATPTLAGSAPLLALAFRSDGEELWAVRAGRAELTIVSANPASGTFGTVVAVSLPGLEPGAVAADPLGRWMYVTDRATNALVLVDPATRAPIRNVPVGAPIGPVGISPDGRYVVCGSGAAGVVIDPSDGVIVGTSPSHTAPAGAITVTANGGRAVALYSGGTEAAVWNLDPALGAPGEEYSYSSLTPGAEPFAHVAALPGGEKVLIASATQPVALSFDAGRTPPVIERVGLDVPAMALTRSADGRRLWRLRPGGAAVDLLEHDDATSIASVAGDGQSGMPGSALPLPITVRVLDAGGVPQAGVAVRFVLADAAQGTLDGGASSLVQVTDVNGFASVRWTLPGAHGAVALTATALGLAGGTVHFAAEALATDAEIPPVVVEMGPADGTTGVRAGSPLFVRFNQPMDPASVAAALSLSVSGATIPGALSFNAARDLALFQPVIPLPFEGTCVWRIASGAIDADGQALATGAVSNFGVEAAPTLAIESVQPPAGPIRTVVTLTGRGFSTTPALNTVRFAGVVTEVLTASESELTCRVPADVPSANAPVSLAVQVGPNHSNTVAFVVHTTDPNPSTVLTSLLLHPGVSDAIVSADGRWFFVANRERATVDVVTLTDFGALVGGTTIGTGEEPVSLALSSDNLRLYVAHAGGEDIWVFSTDPAFASFTFMERIQLDERPERIVYSAANQELYVITGERLQIIDAHPGNATYHRVTAQVTAGSGGRGLVINPDGGEAYWITDDGRLVYIDLRTRTVTATVTTGSSGRGIVISPDGGLLIAILADGRLIVIDNAPSSSQYRRVVASQTVGSGGRGVVINPDGGSVLVLDDRGFLTRVTISVAPANASRGTPGAPVALTVTRSMDIGLEPSSVAVNPVSGAYFLVTRAGSGEAVLVADATSLAPETVEFEFRPGTLDFRHEGQWVRGRIEPGPAFEPRDILVSSLRLNGLVPADTCAPITYGDGDHDGIPDVTVRFRRVAAALVLPEGDSVVVTLTGLIGERLMLGRDTIRVRSGEVLAPLAGEVVLPARDYTVRWRSPHHMESRPVALLLSLDAGATWSMIARHVRNDGATTWYVPPVIADSARIAVVFVDHHCSDDGLEVEGVLATSELFRIHGPTDAPAAPATLALAPIAPNPVAGEARFRFSVPVRAPVELDLFDLQGRRIRSLWKGDAPPGWHDVSWTGRGDHGESVRAGVYFVRLRALGRDYRRRLIWLE